MIAKHLASSGHSVSVLGWFTSYVNAKQYLPLPRGMTYYSTTKIHTHCQCHTPGQFIEKMSADGLVQIYEVKNRTVQPSTLKCTTGGMVEPQDKYGISSFSWVASDAKPDLVLALGDLWMLESYTRGPVRKYYSLVCYLPVDGGPWPSRTLNSNMMIDYGGYEIDWTDSLKRMDRIVAYTDYGKRVINDRIGEEKCQDVIWHGCDTATLYPLSDDDRTAARASFFAQDSLKLLNGDHPQVGPDDLVIGIISRNQPRKAFPLAFEAFARFRTQIDRKAWLYCHAATRDCGWNLDDLGVRFGVSDGVIVHAGLKVGLGVTDADMRTMYNVCDLTTLPSRGEGFGLTIIESMACGVPTVISPYSGHGSPGGWAEGCFEPIAIKAMDTEPITGIDRAIVDVDDYVAALHRTLKPDRYAELTEKGLARAKECDWSKILPQWDKLIGSTPLKTHQYPSIPTDQAVKRSTIQIPSGWKTNPLVSVILPSSVILQTPNYEKVLKQCVTSLDNQTYRPWELTIIDNISHGPVMVDYLNKIRHTVVRWPHPYHPARVLNLATAHTRGDYLLFLHTDCVLDEACLIKLMNVFATRPAVGIVAPALYDEQGKNRMIGYGYNPLHELIPNHEKGEGVLNVEAVSDACMVVSRVVWDRLEGFDPTFFRDYHDWDLCERAKALGFQVLVDTSAECVHYGNVTRRYVQQSLRFMDKRAFTDKHGKLVDARLVA